MLSIRVGELSQEHRQLQAERDALGSAARSLSARQPDAATERGTQVSGNEHAGGY